MSISLPTTRLSKVGDTYNDFRVTKVVNIPELQASLRELLHEPSGALVMQVGNDDPENLFCLSLKTLPNSSNGVAHVLEHTVLCGSKKYPVKDPFFSMTRRSLTTFMNALTGSDFTCYPAASQVPKDFYNLLDVYLDAVFHPHLKEFSYLQEGHRLEFSVPNDPTSPLEHKGIVFNEMKGSLSSPETRLWHAILESLFPDLSYQYNAGGDPKDIANLTYEDLLSFHKTYYHPSRCIFFFYGNMPLEKHLDFIHDRTLKHTKKSESLPQNPKQPRFTSPKKRELSYPITLEDSTNEKAANDKTMLAFGWLTCHILDQAEVLALNVIDIILMGTDSAPLKHALLKSGLCKQATLFLDDDVSEVPVILVCKGAQHGCSEKLEKLVKETFLQVIKEGIPQNLIDAAIHQVEFHRSEITGDGTPFGLTLFMRSVLLRQHGGEPESGLVVHSLCAELRERIAKDTHYLTNLLKKHLVDNTHFVHLVMNPDAGLPAKEHADERAILDTIQGTLSESAKKELVQRAKDLEAFQEAQEKEDLNVLPKVSLSDVPKNTRNFELHREKAGNLELFHHSCFTNSIVYADLVFDLPDLPEEDLPFLRLFTLLLSQMGCGGRSYRENLEYMQEHTGGVGASLTMNVQADNFHRLTPTLNLRGKALYRKGSKLFPLIHDTISSANFDDTPRLHDLLMQHYSGLENSLPQQALKYAIHLSSSQLAVPSHVANICYGLHYFLIIRALAKDFDARAPELVAKLKRLQQTVLGLEGAHLVLSCDGDYFQKLKNERFFGLQDLNVKPFTPWKGKFSLVPIHAQGRIIAAPVAFTSKVFNTTSYTDPVSAALTTTGLILDNKTLHKRIREQGGAYGCGAVNSPLSGNFYFYSYRDPHLTRTLDAFDESIQEVLKGNVTEKDLEEAKLGIIQKLDSPTAPGSRAITAYGWMREGKPLNVRQVFRDRLMKLTISDIQKATEDYIVPGMREGAVVTFAGKELLQKENEVLTRKGETPLVVTSI